MDFANDTGNEHDSLKAAKAPYDGEYVGTIEVVVLRCWPLNPTGDAHLKSSSPKSTTEEPDDQPLLGALFDGASDTKPKWRPKLFDIWSTSALSSGLSSSGRRHRRTSKPERIEIHNSNVHIHESCNGRDACRGHCGGRRSSHHRSVPSRTYEGRGSQGTSDRLSPRTVIADKQHQAGSGWNITYEGSSNDKKTDLRGGAGSSNGSGGGEWANPNRQNDDDGNGDAGWGNQEDTHEGNGNDWNQTSTSRDDWNNNGPVTHDSSGWENNDIANDSGDSNLLQEHAGWTSNDEPGLENSNDWSSGNTDRRQVQGWGDNSDTAQREGSNQWRNDHNNTTGDGPDSWSNHQAQADAQNNWDINATSTNNWQSSNNNDTVTGVEPPRNTTSTSPNSNGDEHDRKLQNGNHSNWGSTNKVTDQTGTAGNHNTAAAVEQETQLGATDPSKKKDARTSSHKRESVPSYTPRQVRGKSQPQSPPVSSSHARAMAAWDEMNAEEEAKRKTTTPAAPPEAPVQSNSPLQSKPPPPASHAAPAPAPSNTPHSSVQTPTTASKSSTKPYFSTWRNTHHPPQTSPLPPKTHQSQPLEPPILLSPSLASSKNLTHTVRPQTPAPYRHKTSKPRYIDSHGEPYAVFSFHYRDRSVIERMLGYPIPEVEGGDDEKTRLNGLSKAEVIEELMRMRNAGTGGGGLSNPYTNGYGYGNSNGVNNISGGTYGATTAWTNPGTWSNLQPSYGPAPTQTPSATGAAHNGTQLKSSNHSNWGKNPRGAGPWAHPSGAAGAGADAAHGRYHNGYGNGNGDNGGNGDSGGGDGGGGGGGFNNETDSRWNGNGNENDNGNGYDNGSGQGGGNKAWDAGNGNGHEGDNGSGDGEWGGGDQNGNGNGWSNGSNNNYGNGTGDNGNVAGGGGGDGWGGADSGKATGGGADDRW